MKRKPERDWWPLEVQRTAQSIERTQMMMELFKQSLLNDDQVLFSINCVQKGCQERHGIRANNVVKTEPIPSGGIRLYIAPIMMCKACFHLLPGTLDVFVGI